METLIGTVPEGWTQVSLGDICAVVAGPGTIGRGEDRASSGVPIVTPRNIRHNRIVANDLMFTTIEAAAKLSRYRLAMGDIVCTRTGELGRNALIEEEQADWLLGTGCMRLRLTGGVIATYLIYYLANSAVRDWIQRNATGSAISSISAKTLSRMPVVLPPLPVQSKIGELLSALDAKIAVHDRISATTATLRDSLLPLLMTGYGSFVDL